MPIHQLLPARSRYSAKFGAGTFEAAAQALERMRHTAFVPIEMWAEQLAKDMLASSDADDKTEPLTPYADLDGEGRARVDEKAKARAAVIQGERDRCEGAHDEELVLTRDEHDVMGRALLRSVHVIDAGRLPDNDQVGDATDMTKTPNEFVFVCASGTAKRETAAVCMNKVMTDEEVRALTGDTDNGFSPMPAAALKEYSF